MKRYEKLINCANFFSKLECELYLLNRSDTKSTVICSVLSSFFRMRANVEYKYFHNLQSDKICRIYNGFVQYFEQYIEEISDIRSRIDNIYEFIFDYDEIFASDEKEILDFLMDSAQSCLSFKKRKDGE